MPRKVKREEKVVLPAAIINHKTFCWDFSHLLVFRCLFFKFFNYFKCKWGNKFGCGLRGYSCAWSAKRSWRYVNENRSKKEMGTAVPLEFYVFLRWVYFFFCFFPALHVSHTHAGHWQDSHIYHCQVYMQGNPLPPPLPPGTPPPTKPYHSLDSAWGVRQSFWLVKCAFPA